MPVQSPAREGAASHLPRTPLHSILFAYYALHPRQASIHELHHSPLARIESNARTCA